MLAHKEWQNADNLFSGDKTFPSIATRKRCTLQVGVLGLVNSELTNDEFYFS